jgi:dGTP triphosphohydrolase
MRRAASRRWWLSATRRGRNRSELKRFLFHNLYRHPRVMETTGQAQEVVRDLFARYLADPARCRPASRRARDTPRAVADYIAGMTDRYACASTSGSPAAGCWRLAP